MPFDGMVVRSGVSPPPWGGCSLGGGGGGLCLFLWFTGADKWCMGYREIDHSCIASWLAFGAVRYKHQGAAAVVR